MKFGLRYLLCGGLALALAAPAAAQVIPGPTVIPQQPRSVGPAPRVITPANTPTPTARQVSGEIISTTTGKLRNSEVRHQLVRVRANDGNIRLIDLGPADARGMEDLSLEPGNRITADGRFIRVGRADVFFASSARTGDAELTVRRTMPLPGDRRTSTSARPTDRADAADRTDRTDRTGPRPRTGRIGDQDDVTDRTPRSDRFGPAPRTTGRTGDRDDGFGRARRTGRTDTTGRPARPEGEERTIRGKIVRTKRVDWRGSDRREFVALVETDDGSKVIVDLGPTTGLKDANIRTGQQVTARGRMTRLGEQQALFATRVDTGRGTLVINREVFRRGKTEELRGTVMRTKRVDWRGADRREYVALVKPQSGEPVVVDLGPTINLRDAGVQSGRPITVRGTYRQMGDTRVMFADRVTTAEASNLAIRRGRSDGTESRTVTGTVGGTRQVGLRDGSDKNFVILIKTPEGRQEVADLGSARRARDYDLQEGDKVTVKGRVFEVQGRPVLIVTEVTANGETRRVDRPVRSESFRRDFD